MKAKEWAAKLLELIHSVDDDSEATSEAYMSAVEALSKECLDIATMRLGGALTGQGSMGAIKNTLLLNALREASVKWEAVVHRVTTQLGRQPYFPLMRGGFYLSFITSLDTLFDTPGKSTADLDATQIELREFSEALGYKDVTVINIILDRYQVVVTNRKLADIRDYVGKFGELRDLTQKGNNGSLSVREEEDKAYLQQWLATKRGGLITMLEKADGMDKLRMYQAFGTLHE